MEKAAEGFLSKIGGYLAEATIRQGRYLCCFNKIVKDLQEEETNLTLAKERMEGRVRRARNNTEIIEKDVKKWQSDSSNILEEVAGLRSEIEEKKSCLKGWCPNCCCRYWLGRKATKKTIIMKRLVENGKIENVGRLASLPDDLEFLPPKDFEFFQSSKSVFEQIIEALKNDQINLVGLHGMGGTGKTTLARAVGENVKGKTFDKVITVTVSQTPDFEDIQAHLAHSLGLQLQEKTEEDRAKRLFKRFVGTDTETDKKQETEKILVILDDVWESFDLRAKIGISFEGDNMGCKVLLTTRLEQVCIDMNCQQRTQLNVLEEEEGLALLKKHAGIGDDSSLFNRVATQVARECGGLPLALVAIGCALKEKEIDEWNAMYRKLQKSKLEDIRYSKVAGDKGIYATLKVSYDYLRDEKSKSCFLLCSLFPEDRAIRLEELVWYAMGLGWYQDADSTEEARSDLVLTVRHLKASGLLLYADEEYVKMHDMIRDIALWIASHGENVFMSKVGMEQIDWSKEKDWERYTAISLLANKIDELSVGLACPKLEILMLGGESSWKMLKVSDKCFEEMKGLKVLSLTYVDLSLKSLEFLKNLKTLQLVRCNTRDISYLKKLNRLEILLFYDPPDELPREICELHNLRVVHLNKSVRIPSNVLGRCSQLEELYALDKFRNNGVEETSMAGIFEVISLSRLRTLHFSIHANCLPKDLAFPKLQRYVICLNTDSYMVRYKRALEISDVEAVSLIAFKALYEELEYLGLRKTTGCENILPSIDEGGLNELNSLVLSYCNDLKYIIDTLQQHVPANAFTNLVNLSFSNLIHLTQICYGGRLPKGFLEKLEIIEVIRCFELRNLFPPALLLRLQQLKKVKISSCNKLQDLFQLEGYYQGRDNFSLLPSLAELVLEDLPRLRYILKGPTQCVNFQSLTNLYIDSCRSLEYIFPISVAQNLVGLEELAIKNAPQVKQVFYMDHASEIDETDGKDIVLHKLRILTLYRLQSLTSFVKENYHLTCPTLEEVHITKCSSLTTSFSFGDKMPDLKENLRVVKIERCHFQLCDGLTLSGLRHGFKSLEELTINNCGVKVVFQLEGFQTAIDGEKREPSLPSLKKLTLESLKELEDLVKGPKDILSLQNLTHLFVCNCPKLRHVFPWNLAPNLLPLEELSIVDCEEMEYIIVEDSEEDHPQPLFFQNLRKINVDKCGKLKYLFPISIIQHLQQLESIRVNDCDQLEKVFEQREVLDVMNDKEILLPQLKELSLIELPSLTNFGPEGYHFILKLNSLSISCCYQMCTGGCSCRDHVIFICGLQHELNSLEDAEGLCKGPTNILSPQNLFKLCIINCERLKQIFSSNLAQNMLQLEELHIKDCEELEQIVVALDHDENHIQTPFFPNLRRIDVSGCNKLKHLFPVNIAAGLQQLQSIDVQGCDQLEKIFGHKNGGDEMNGKELDLPSQLMCLCLEELPSLTNFGPVGYQFPMRKLKLLTMEGCNEQLWNSFKDWEDFSVDSFPVSDAYYEQEHVTVSICRVGGCEFRISGVNKSDLTCVGDQLDLGLCKGLTLTLTLHNLSELYIHGCHKMRHIFSSNLARNLLQLEELIISDCEELEQIIVEDGEDDHIQSHQFLPKLWKIDISGCNKLKYVFPITMVQGLEKLEIMVVKECDQLEEVFVDRDDIMDDKEVEFFGLECLELEELRRLINFCPTGFHCKFPYLQTLTVKECPKIATRFSRGECDDDDYYDDEKYGIVHAEGKPPNEGDHPTMDIIFDDYED